MEDDEAVLGAQAKQPSDDRRGASVPAERSKFVVEFLHGHTIHSLKFDGLNDIPEPALGNCYPIKHPSFQTMTRYLRGCGHCRGIRRLCSFPSEFLYFKCIEDTIFMSVQTAAFFDLRPPLSLPFLLTEVCLQVYTFILIYQSRLALRLSLFAYLGAPRTFTSIDSAQNQQEHPLVANNSGNEKLRSTCNPRT